VALTDADREALFARLSAHAAAEHISLEELERRVAVVSAADTRDQALAVLADLPAPPAREDAPAPGAEPGRPRWGQGHGDVDRPGADWRPTAERFRDPRTRRVVRVWEDAAGGRHYVDDDD
jgi:hypothetical protein